MKKLHNNYNVYIHNYCHTTNIINDKKEAVQLIYILKYIMSCRNTAYQVYYMYESVKY